MKILVKTIHINSSKHQRLQESSKIGLRLVLRKTKQEQFSNLFKLFYNKFCQKVVSNGHYKINF